MQQRAKQLKELILAKKNSKPATSVPTPPPVTQEPPAEALQAEQLLESISKELEMQDQEGSEEGEIDERSEPPPILPTTPQLDTRQDYAPRRKRKHNDVQSARVWVTDKADRKARKKAKKANKQIS